ncbi:excisionase family DNA binding protein [Kitasatospora sp. SolWspMP-SS2h]|uniref:helix-turn-helix domain-containing protein n=1 Tax=Kitasatospora sp. SolWspMP-SS2h TaxID=1305729 RepID=UPI000DB96A00|nr:helix-turn-helix domain-containing protein [Kitasatospora sp. SolWspMP-SS2h]RAJ43669.1 excisionase family DNA binding protein [Kitasatospora sp. SolWspMP-SS2h]
MNNFYSVEDVAELLGLHVKTVRGYVRDGKLKAVRIGKQYRIARAEVEAFTGGGVALKPARVDVSAVVQVEGVGARDADRLVTGVLAAANAWSGGPRPLWVQAVREEERSALRFVVMGPPRRVADVLALVDDLTGEVR